MGVPGTTDKALPMCSSLPSELSVTCRPGRVLAAQGWLHPWPGDDNGTEHTGVHLPGVWAAPGPRPPPAWHLGPLRPLYLRLQLPQPLSSGPREGVGLSHVPLSRPSPGSERWGCGAGADTRTPQEGEPQLPMGTGPPHAGLAVPCTLRASCALRLPGSRACMQVLAVHTSRRLGRGPGEGWWAEISRWLAKWPWPWDSVCCLFLHRLARAHGAGKKDI